MVSFHVDSDLDILFKKLTAQIGARPGLRTLLRFETDRHFQSFIIKIQQLTLD